MAALHDPIAHAIHVSLAFPCVEVVAVVVISHGVVETCATDDNDTRLCLGWITINLVDPMDHGTAGPSCHLVVDGLRPALVLRVPVARSASDDNRGRDASAMARINHVDGRAQGLKDGPADGIPVVVLSLL